jgi:predicted DNA-binding antitoxin AbrB/MazE fold protein
MASMAQTISAVYEKGVIRPLQPLNLPEGQPLHIQVLSEEPVQTSEQVQQNLVEPELWVSSSESDIEPVPEKVWQDLMRKLEQRSIPPSSEGHLE